MTPLSRARIDALLRRKAPLLLDGGLATELESQGHKLESVLWSAELLESAPEAIVAAHRAYLAAGAEVLITASYQLSSLGLRSAGYAEQRLPELVQRCTQLADSARAAHLKANPASTSPLLIAASVGPYGAALADGSEYSGDYGVSDAELRDFHADRLKLLDSSGADLLACETLPSEQEARVLSELLRQCQTPAWVSFSCRDGAELNDGSSLRSCARLFASHPVVLAVGVNCTSPRYTLALLEELRAGAPRQAHVVYPNSGETFDVQERTWHGTATPAECGAAALEWRAKGADLIGGCCRMGPEHIRAMAGALRS